MVRHLQLNPGQIQGANQPNSSSRHPFYYKKPPCRLLTAKICNLLKLGEVLLILNMKTRIFAAAILNLEAILKMFFNNVYEITKFFMHAKFGLPSSNSSCRNLTVIT